MRWFTNFITVLGAFAILCNQAWAQAPSAPQAEPSHSASSNPAPDDVTSAKDISPETEEPVPIEETVTKDSVSDVSVSDVSVGEDGVTDGSSPEPAPSEAEMAELEAAMQQDAAEQSSEPAEPASSVGQAIQSLNPNIALILDVAAAYFSSDEPLQTGGHDPTRTGFNLQQLEMSIDASVDPYLRFDANIVFAEFGVEVEEAYFTTLSLPASLQLRGGQLLTQFGRINATHPHAWSFADQPLVVGKFLGSEGSRGLGAELSWLAPLPWYAMVVASATNPWGECCARSFFGGADIPVSGPQDLLYTTALKQFFPISNDWSLFWGLSGQLGPNPTGQGNRTEIYATDIYLRWRPVAAEDRMALSFSAEGMSRRRQVPGDVLVDYGAYAQAVWSINPRWETGVRYEYVTGVESDPLEDVWFEDRQRASAQVTFHPSHFSRFRLQGNFDNPQWLEDPVWAAFLTAEVVVGSHGSHSY